MGSSGCRTATVMRRADVVLPGALRGHTPGRADHRGSRGNRLRVGDVILGVVRILRIEGDEPVLRVEFKDLCMNGEPRLEERRKRPDTHDASRLRDRGW